MRANITEKIKQGARVGVWGLAGIVAAGGMVGCEVIGAGMRYDAQTNPNLTPKGRIAQMEAANLASTYGQWQHEMNVAEAGKPEFNVYQGDQEQSQNNQRVIVTQSVEAPTIFTCNFYRDFNNDGMADYPQEYGGIKNQFKKDEGLTLVVYECGFRSLIKHNLSVKIYNSREEEVFNWEGLVDGAVNSWGKKQDFMNSILKAKGGGPGTYKVVAYSFNGKFVGSHEFEITE